MVNQLFSNKNFKNKNKPYVKQITSPGSMHETGCSGLVHWNDPEGWDGEGSRKGVQNGKHMYTMADSCQCMTEPLHYCKVISLQLNKFIFKN